MVVSLSIPAPTPTEKVDGTEARANAGAVERVLDHASLKINEAADHIAWPGGKIYRSTSATESNKAEMK